MSVESLSTIGNDSVSELTSTLSDIVDALLDAKQLPAALDEQARAMLEAWQGEKHTLARCLTDVLWYRSFELSEELVALETREKARNDKMQEDKSRADDNDNDDDNDSNESAKAIATVDEQLLRLDAFTSAAIRCNLISKQVFRLLFFVNSRLVEFSSLNRLRHQHNRLQWNVWKAID